MNAKQQKEADDRMEAKVTRNGGRIIAKSAAKVVAYFDEGETAYLYDRADEAKQTWIPGRPILQLTRCDAPQAEFEALLKKLV